MVAQCIVSIIFGSLAFLSLHPFPDNRQVPLIGGLMAGFLAAWVWRRIELTLIYGWRHALKAPFFADD